MTKWKSSEVYYMIYMWRYNQQLDPSLYMRDVKSENDPPYIFYKVELHLNAHPKVSFSIRFIITQKLFSIKYLV